MTPDNQPTPPTNSVDPAVLLSYDQKAMQKMFADLIVRASKGNTLTVEELRSYKWLKKELEEQVNNQNNTTPSSPPVPDTPGTTFPNIIKVLEYLKEQRWKIEKSTLYKDRKAGLIAPDEKGEFPLSRVETYIKTKPLVKMDGTTAQSSEADKIALEAAHARRRRETAQARLAELKVNALEGQLVPRDAFEKELAARAAIFKTDGENYFRSHAAERVAIVGGDPVKIPDLIAFDLDTLEQWLARYLQREEFAVDISSYAKIFERADRDELDDEESLAMSAVNRDIIK